MPLSGTAQACGALPTARCAGGLQGVWLRDYVPVSARKEGDPEYSGEDMGEVRASNAYQRRIAGAPPPPPPRTFVNQRFLGAGSVLWMSSVQVQWNLQIPQHGGRDRGVVCLLNCVCWSGLLAVLYATPASGADALPGIGPTFIARMILCCRKQLELIRNASNLAG